MPETRNTFYWITWEVNISLVVKFDQFMQRYKKNIFVKNLYKKQGLVYG